MLPVLKLAAEGETSAPDVEQKIADELALTPEERAQLLPTGRQRILHNRIHWARFYLGKAGLIDSPKRGRFVASEAGRKLLATNPDHIDKQRLLEIPIFREYYSIVTSSEGNPAGATYTPSPTGPAIIDTPQATPEEQIESANSAIQSVLKADLLQRILANSPSFFEALIIELLVAMGYGGSRRNAATQLGQSGAIMLPSRGATDCPASPVATPPMRRPGGRGPTGSSAPDRKARQ